MYKTALQKLFILLMLIILPVFIIKRHNIFRDRTAYLAEKRTDQIVDIADKRFIVVMPFDTLNDEAEQSLHSVMMQNYPNYEILFIDTRSNSQIQNDIHTLYTKVRKELSESGMNNFPAYAIKRNYYNAIKSLNDEDIVIHFDSSSWFTQPNTFERVARIFTNSDIWLAYSPYIDYPSHTHVLDHTHKGEKWWKLHVRKSDWIKSPLKIYYAGLFKQIQYEGTQAPQIQLSIFLLPLVEKAKRHITYIKDPLYYHDSSQAFSNDTVVFQPEL